MAGDTWAGWTRASTPIRTCPGQLAELLLRDGIRVGQSAWVRTDALVRDAQFRRIGQLRALRLQRGLSGHRAAGHREPGIPAQDQRRGGRARGLAVLREQFPEVLAIGSFIYGLPGDTPATIRAIHRLASELELDQFFFIPLTPLPGTAGWRAELWDPTGERFREFNFLPTGRRTGATPNSSARCCGRC